MHTATLQAVEPQAILHIKHDLPDPSNQELPSHHQSHHHHRYRLLRQRDHLPLPVQDSDLVAKWSGISSPCPFYFGFSPPSLTSYQRCDTGINESDCEISIISVPRMDIRYFSSMTLRSIIIMFDNCYICFDCTKEKKDKEK